MQNSAVPRRVRHVRYGPAEWAVVEAAASEQQVPPSTFVRSVSVRAARLTIAHADERTATGVEIGNREVAS